MAALAGAGAMPPISPGIVQSLQEFSRMSLLRKVAMECVAFSLGPRAIGSLREDFIAMDTDRSGTLSLMELREGLLRAARADEAEQRQGWIEENPLSQRRPDLSAVNPRCPTALQRLVVHGWADEPKGGRGASATCQPTGPCGGEASVASFLAAAVTDIYLCNACSYQETLRRNGRGRRTATTG